MIGTMFLLLGIQIIGKSSLLFSQMAQFGNTNLYIYRSHIGGFTFRGPNSSPCRTNCRPPVTVSFVLVLPANANRKLEELTGSRLEG